MFVETSTGFYWKHIGGIVGHDANDRIAPVFASRVVAVVFSAWFWDVTSVFGNSLVQALVALEGVVTFFQNR